MANELHEFVKGYESCFFRIALKASGRPRAFLMHGLDGTEIYGETVTSTLQYKSARFVASDFLKKNDPLIGVSQFVNCALDRPTAILLMIDPDRQYRKALCIDSSSSAFVLRTGSKEHDNYLILKSAGVTKEAFLMRAVAHQLAVGGPNYRPFRIALEAVESGAAHSVALSRFFALSLAAGYKYPVLWHKMNRVGFIVDGTIYGTEEGMPYADFFFKRFDVKMLPLEKAPR